MNGVTILIIILIVLAVGGHPRFGNFSNYYFSGGLGLVVLILIILLLTGHL